MVLLCTQHHGGSREKWKNVLIADQCGVVRAAADRSGSVVKDGRQVCDALAIADRSEGQAWPSRQYRGRKVNFRQNRKKSNPNHGSRQICNAFAIADRSGGQARPSRQIRGRKSISDRSATLSPSQTEVGARHGRADRFGAESQFQRESKQKPPYIREDSK